MVDGFHFTFDRFPTTLENLPHRGRGSFLDEGHNPNPHLVSRTAAPTTTSLPDFPWSQKHKFPNSLFTREFHMRQLSKGIGSDQN